MKIFTRRNAVVGYVTIKAIKQARKSKRRKKGAGSKLALYTVLGLVSFGVLAALAAYRRRRRAATLAERIEEVAEAAADLEEAATVEELAGEVAFEAEAAMEPIPAT